jgi:hypothetical protein
MAKKADTRIDKAVQTVRDAKDAAADSLSSVKYKQFLEELLSDAEGWRMELDDSDEDDT